MFIKCQNKMSIMFGSEILTCLVDKDVTKTPYIIFPIVIMNVYTKNNEYAKK